MKPIQSYIRSQGIACVVINAVLNPAIAWLGNRQMAFVSLTGENSLVVDTAVTCVVLSLLVSLFVTPAVRAELSAGQLSMTGVATWEACALSRLPVQAWSVGLIIGVAAAAVLTPLIFGVFHLAGSSGVPFAAFALLKATYTPVLGYLVTRWVILRQVMSYRADLLHGAAEGAGYNPSRR